jgi:F-type H+-transporting ATPase subunit a
MTFIINVITSPVEQFEVSPLLYISGPLVGDIVFSLTNVVIYAIVVTFLVVGGSFVIDNNHRLVPSYWSTITETLYASVYSFSNDQLSSKHISYFPFINALFITLLISNLVGNVPYGYTLTSTAIITIGLSFTIFIGVTIIGFIIHRIGFFAYFVPAGTPLALVPILVLIEVVSYLARAVSLGVRLAANIIAGHILLAILATFLSGLFTTSVIIATVTLVPFAIFTILICLELAVSAIQAYVFCTLVASYIKDAQDLHLLY